MRMIVVMTTAVLGFLASGAPATAATDPAISCYTLAVNSGGAAEIAACFTSGAVVVDVGRRFAGRAAIRAWARAEVAGGRITVVRTVSRNASRSTTTLLMRFAPDGGSGGFRANYRFTTSRGRITRLVLTYA